MRKDATSTQSGSDSLLFPRRQFLVLGSTAVAAVAVTSVSADILTGALVIEDKAPRLSVGFAEAMFADFAAAQFSARVKPASELRAGDSSLGDGVRMTIHGLVRPEALREQPSSMGLDVMYRVVGRNEEVPFLAWSYARLGQQTLTSVEQEFVVPINTRQPLSLVVSTIANPESKSPKLPRTKLQGTVSLSVAEGRGNKMRPGVYFIAVSPAGSQEPSWSSVQAVPSEKGKPVLMQAGLAGLEPVSFDYIVVSTAKV